MHEAPHLKFTQGTTQVSPGYFQDTFLSIIRSIYREKKCIVFFFDESAAILYNEALCSGGKPTTI